MAGTLTRKLAGIGRWLKKEFVAILPVFIFLFFGFAFLILLVKLTLEQFSIEVAVVSNALIGAFTGAKVALVLDETQLARSLERYRRIVTVAAKVLFYAIATLLLGYVERFLEALHKAHSFEGAIGDVIAHTNHYRLLAWVLGISFIFAFYFALVETNKRMGKGELWKLFFESPETANDSSRSSNIEASGRRWSGSSQRDQPPLAR
jgi:hypothetical protein